MNDPKHLIDEATGFEAELLRAGRRDALPARSALLIAAALGVAPPATAATATSALGLAAKVASVKSALAVAGLGAAGALSVWAGVNLLSTDAPAPSPRERVEAREPAPASAARDVEPIAPAEPIRSTEISETAPPPSPKAPARSARSAVAADVDTLPREFEAIDEARSALARGDASRALSLLDAYAARFPKPRLRAESTVLRIEALVVRGQGDAAARVGKEFLAREPNGPYARRVRSLLEKAGVPPAR